MTAGSQRGVIATKAYRGVRRIERHCTASKKTIASTEEVGAVSMSPSTSLLAELFADLQRIDETSILPDGDWVSVCVATWAAEWVTRLKDAGLIIANVAPHERDDRSVS